VSIRFARTGIFRGEPAERVLCVVGDVNRDGNDEVVIGQRAPKPRLSWLGRDASGTWREHLIDDTFDHLEAGGFLHDIDGDGRLDLVAGADGRGDRVWWWQCPADPGDPAARWTRREIFRMPANQSHDQLIADLDGDGRPEVYFWNQGARALFAATIPDDPRTEPWPTVTTIATDVTGEGLAAADVDGDGGLELLAGLRWYKCDRDDGWQSRAFAQSFVSTRLAVADFDGDGRVEIAISEGDASLNGRAYGRLAVCTRGANPREPWSVRLLHDRLLDPHSLAAADFDGDGRCELFVGELGDPNGDPEHEPALRIYRWDGEQFEEQVIERTSFGVHEARPIRIDGRLGIVGKPYRNLHSTAPRPPEIDTIHLWLPE
jgi:hypothetical protein